MSFGGSFAGAAEVTRRALNNRGEQDRAERALKVHEDQNARASEDQEHQRKLRNIAEQYIKSFAMAEPSEMEGKSQGLDGDAGDKPIRRAIDMHIPGLDRREFDGSQRTEAGNFTPDKLTQYRMDLSRQAMALTNPAAMPEFEARLKDRDFQTRVKELGSWASQLRINPGAAAARFPQIAKMIDPSSKISGGRYDPATKSIIATDADGNEDSMTAEEMFRSAITFADPMKQYELSKMDLDMEGKRASIKNTEAMTDLHGKQAAAYDAVTQSQIDARRTNSDANLTRAKSAAEKTAQRAEKRKTDDASYQNQWNTLDNMQGVRQYSAKRPELDVIGRRLMDVNPDLDGAQAANITFAVAQGKIQTETQQLGPLKVKTLAGKIYGIDGVSPEQERQLLEEIATPEGQAKLRQAKPPQQAQAPAQPRTALQAPTPNRRAVQGKIQYGPK